MGSGLPGPIPQRRTPPPVLQTPLPGPAASEATTAEVKSPAAESASSGRAGGAGSLQQTNRFTELENAPPDAQNPELKVRKQLDGKKDKFLADLRKPPVEGFVLPSFGPKSEPLSPGLGQDVQEAVQKFEADPQSLMKMLETATPQVLGGLFAQASPEKLAACLNELGTASEAERREQIPKLLDAMAAARPPVQLAQETLQQLDPAALRGLATHASDNSRGAAALGSSGLLGELIQRDGGHSGNQMAALEGLSRMPPAALPAALNELGVTQETLTGWIRDASATHPMASKGGWVNPETAQRLADKLAAQPNGAGLATAAAVISSTLAGKAGKGLEPDAGLNSKLEHLLDRANSGPLSKQQKAEVAKAVVDTDLFRHPETLTPEMRQGITNLIGSAGKEFTELYTGKTPFTGGDASSKLDQLTFLTNALGFSGSTQERQAFNTLWGNLIGSHLKSAVDENKGSQSFKAGMLLSSFTEGARKAQSDHDSYVKSIQDLLGFAVGGIGGGFSWRMGNYNLTSPLKEGGKSLVQDVAKSFFGRGPESEQSCVRLQDYLLKQAGQYAEQSRLHSEDWVNLLTKFVAGRESRDAY